MHIVESERSVGEYLIPVSGREAWEVLSEALDAVESVPCRTDPEDWWSVTPRVVGDAVDACTGCTVLEKCLAYAVAADEKFGVWGGRTPAERGHRAPKRRKGAA